MRFSLKISHLLDAFLVFTMAVLYFLQDHCLFTFTQFLQCVVWQGSHSLEQDILYCTLSHCWDLEEATTNAQLSYYTLDTKTFYMQQTFSGYSVLCCSMLNWSMSMFWYLTKTGFSHLKSHCQCLAGWMRNIIHLNLFTVIPNSDCCLYHLNLKDTLLRFSPPITWVSLVVSTPCTGHSAEVGNGSELLPSTLKPVPALPCEIDGPTIERVP